MTEKEMIDLALAEGVSAAEMTDTKDIVFDPMFRPFCAENLCGQYGSTTAALRTAAPRRK